MLTNAIHATHPRKNIKLWYLGTFCERITVNLALKNNQNNPDNEIEEDEIEDEWDCSSLVILYCWYIIRAKHHWW